MASPSATLWMPRRFVGGEAPPSWVHTHGPRVHASVAASSPAHETVAPVVESLAMALATVLAVGEPQRCGAELFRLTRSTNANVVLYEAHTSVTGNLDRARPVHPVWLMLAEDGRREELTGLERSLAYGVEVRPATEPDTAVVALRAEPARPVSIRRHDGCLVAIATIGGHDARLRSIHVEVAGFFPTVRSVELVGSDLDTGTERREIVVPRQAPTDGNTRNSRW
jgi:hypothetical protein